MRKLRTLAMLPALAVLVFSGLAWANEYFTEIQALTRADPASSSDGASIINSRGFQVSVCAESGQTLSGAGSLKAWYYHPVAELWMRNPALDHSVTVSAVRCQAFPDQRRTSFGGGRVLYAASGVTVSGGTTVTVRIVLTSTQP